MMNRRQFLVSLTGLGAVLATGAQAAVPFAFEEGVHYKHLPDAARSVVAKGMVQEFFFYGCSHCMDMEPNLHAWMATKPKGIQVEQIPAVFQSPSWAFLARAHYALKQSDQLSAVHASVFEIYLQDRSRPKTESELADLMADKVTTFRKDAFVEAFASDGVTQSVNRAAKLSGLYQLEAVPTFVINGQYLTDLTMAGSHAKLFSLIEHFAAK